MKNKINIPRYIYNKLNIDLKSKVYYSNIGFIIVSKKGDFVYKCFLEKKNYNKELYIYNLLNGKDINIPAYRDLGKIDSYYILELENIRKQYKRKNILKDLDLKQIAKIVSMIHNIRDYEKNLILGDIHSSNFFEINKNDQIELGIFDFSSCRYGEIEEDIANIYIDLELNHRLLHIFLDSYIYNIDFKKILNYAIIELYERIKNGMNLELKKKQMYYKYILKLKNILGK